MEHANSSLPISDMRRDYTAAALSEADAGDDPMALFARWFAEAREAAPVPHDVNAMTLATVDAEGRPDARIVLLKEVTGGDFIFYTNTAGVKAQQLAAVAHAALVMHWTHLDRQVRVRGSVERVPREQAERYFHQRPRGSQLGAAASRQSQPIADRTALERSLAHWQQRYPEGDVPMPDDWGGYRVVAQTLEFWQGRTHRLHDRLVYTRQGDGWHRQRLSP